MRNRVPVKRDERGALPDFAPVPRQGNRHDGWTPERQKAFIEALADTGSVTRAAAMVNMAQTNCYALRRAPGAEGFRRAWDRAIDFGVGRMKDIAFERAINGYLVPVFVGGKLMGFRRKRNDALLMFCLRHYGPSAPARRTTISYSRSAASAEAGTGARAVAAAGTGAGAQAAAEASTTLVRTVIAGEGDAATLALSDDRSAATIAGFAGVTLDAEAQAALERVLADNAARARAHEAVIDAGGVDAGYALVDDPDESFIGIGEARSPYCGEMEPGVTLVEDEPFREDEPRWQDYEAPRPARRRRHGGKE